MKALMKHLLFLTMLVVVAGTAHAAIDTAKVQKLLLASNMADDDQFGNSVSVSGNTAVIGAWADDYNGIYSGAAYIFVRAADGTWSQQAKLTAADGKAGDYFGGSVSVSGDTAVIGADHASSAYVFVRAVDGTWSQQAKLTAADGAADDLFGWSVALSGDSVVIGARLDDDNGANSGSAYVFVRAADGTWNQQAKLTAADGAANNYFGGSMDMSGDTAVIGAEGDDDKDEASGSAYVFVGDGNGAGQRQGEVTAVDGGGSGIFG
jgi:hypothetical protein